MKNSSDGSQRRPRFSPLTFLLGVFLGLALGLLIGWVIAPVSWTPNADDVQAIADSYSLNSDLNLARARLRDLSTDAQVRIFKKLISDSNARTRPIEAEHATALAQALQLPMDSTPSDSLSISSLAPFAIVGAIVIVGLFIIAGGVFVRGVLPQLRAAPPRDIADTVEAPVQPEKPKPPVTGTAGLGRYVATYNAGIDNFDTSFPLESSRHGFLGECGIGVSETMDAGLPDKVTAFDLWLFDKTDVRTVTQIVMSEYAFNDQGLRAKLRTKGEAVLAAKGRVLTLETQSLRIEARIQDMAYATNSALAQNSYFQKLVVEIASYIR